MAQIGHWCTFFTLLGRPVHPQPQPPALPKLSEVLVILVSAYGVGATKISAEKPITDVETFCLGVAPV
jgi:hypothetical protein